MGIEVLPWHWVVFGIVLVVSEAFLTTFFILWFGVAAIIVGGLLFLLPALPLSWQMFTWSLLSVGLAFAWFKYLKPLAVDRTKAGLSLEALTGEIGQVLKVPTGENRGTLRFPAPLLGNDEWLIMSQDELAIGDRVSVSAVSGNALIVEKVS